MARSKNPPTSRAIFSTVWPVAFARISFNVSRILHYSRSDTALSLQASGDEARAADLRASADYRRYLVAVLSEQVLAAAWRRAEGVPA